MLHSNPSAQITTAATSSLQQCTFNRSIDQQLKQLEEQRSPECLINELYEKTQKFWKLEFKQDDVKSLAICYLSTVFSEADRNNPKACFLRGRCYDLGFGLQKDKDKAKEWYETARKLGQIHSIYNLYDNQNNKLIKMQLEQEGLAKGEVRFLYNKARKIFLEKVHTEVSNLNEAISIMQSLMRQNDNYAHYLGWLMKSRSSKYTRQEAENHLKIYYQKLRPKRKYDLFLAFQLMDLDLYSQAINLFQHIYDTCPPSVQLQKGNIQYSIGLCYRKLQKMEKAKFWQKKAIGKKLVKSFVNLANIYANEGQSELEKELLHKAMKLGKGVNDEQNLSTAYHNLGACYDESEQFEKQFQCYNQACKLGHLNCAAMNGYMLYYGMGVKMDKTKGMDLIERASKQGSQKGEQLINKIKAREAQKK